MTRQYSTTNQETQIQKCTPDPKFHQVETENIIARIHKASRGEKGKEETDKEVTHQGVVVTLG